MSLKGATVGSDGWEILSLEKQRFFRDVNVGLKIFEELSYKKRR